jgi:hypothetical protein
MSKFFRLEDEWGRQTPFGFIFAIVTMLLIGLVLYSLFPGPVWDIITSDY